MKPNTAIKLREQFKGQNPSEVSFYYNKWKLIQDALMYNALLVVLCVAIGGFIKNEYREFLTNLIILFVLAITLLSGYYFKKIRKGKPALIVQKKGIQISDKPFLAWDTIQSIQVIYRPGLNDIPFRYTLQIVSDSLKWQIELRSLAMELDEVCHWMAYFKKKRRE